VEVLLVVLVAFLKQGTQVVVARKLEDSKVYSRVEVLEQGMVVLLVDIVLLDQPPWKPLLMPGPLMVPYVPLLAVQLQSTF
jgi:hypothetical protein